MLQGGISRPKWRQVTVFNGTAIGCGRSFGGILFYCLYYLTTFWHSQPISLNSWQMIWRQVGQINDNITHCDVVFFYATKR